MALFILQQSEGQAHFYLKQLKQAEVIAYDDLGTEAIRKLEVENLPAIVVIDSEGSYLYEDVAKKYRKI